MFDKTCLNLLARASNINESQRSTTERIQKKREGKTELDSTKECAHMHFATYPKHSAFLPTATVSCISEKTVCFGSIYAVKQTQFHNYIEMSDKF